MEWQALVYRLTEIAKASVLVLASPPDMSNPLIRRNVRAHHRQTLTINSMKVMLFILHHLLDLMVFPYSQHTNTRTSEKLTTTHTRE